MIIVSTWASRALKDGKITISEALTLAGRLADLLALPTEFTAPFFDVFLDELKHENLIMKEGK